MTKIYRQNELLYHDIAVTNENYLVQAAFPRLYADAGAKQIIFDMRTLNPGKLAFAYHFHRASEELFIIISGSMTLRSPEGFRVVSAGDVIFFEVGETGAHQVYNHTDEPCVYFDLRTNPGIDIAEYPDTGKINILPSFEVFNLEDKTGYFEGEEGVMEYWKEYLSKKTENE